MNCQWNLGEMHRGESESLINNRLFRKKNTNGSNLGIGRKNLGILWEDINCDIYFFFEEKPTADQILINPQYCHAKCKSSWAISLSWDTQSRKKMVCKISNWPIICQAFLSPFLGYWPPRDWWSFWRMENERWRKKLRMSRILISLSLINRRWHRKEAL